MLEELEIHDLGPIHRALLTPAGGMTAITGETGAGKSMLLSAIRLISAANFLPHAVPPVWLDGALCGRWAGVFGFFIVSVPAPSSFLS